MRKEPTMPQNKKTKKDCFFFMYGKCARDEENSHAVKPCQKKCEFFVTWENLLNGIRISNK